ncbi:MAG: 16S rRNA (uracil(1498)-N(3))-methyltransferase [Candidatus Eremiobacteraeota bacterium]|nr:16S rRNA (uracil(1498)-N(3))-methyltransferase [Candidatus Eremiobacteraeota bacterium]
MSARRFFVEGLRAPGSVIDITGGDARKIVAVLRLGAGDRVELIDSGGTLFDAVLSVDDGRVCATLTTVLPAEPEANANPLRVDVAQAMPKGRKMDFVVEKTTELGVGTIVPFSSERSIAGDPSGTKLERWRRLSKTASQQSGRRSVARVEDPIAFDRLLERFSTYDVVLFPWELAPHVPLRDRLPLLLESAHTALVVIGPEGGFSHDEAGAAVERGAEMLWLGPRILRTETAAMALLAIIGAFAGLSSS